MMVNSKPTFPGYDLDAKRILTVPSEIRALTHPLRGILLDLLLERAATITELSVAVKRPKSTIAHHVTVLLDAELLRVVSTRRVRAIEERVYGRTARLFTVGPLGHSDLDPVPWSHPLSAAMRESQASYLADTMWANLRHSRIPRSSAVEFWKRVEDLMEEFSTLPRDGDEVFGFATALFPADFPSLDRPAEGGS